MMNVYLHRVSYRGSTDLTNVYCTGKDIFKCRQVDLCAPSYGSGNDYDKCLARTRDGILIERTDLIQRLLFLARVG